MSFIDCSGVRSVLAQRRQLALYNVPLTRLTLTSPYPQFTKIQLDMRRKIEILKHSNNASNTKTNNLTKKQNWSLLVQGKTQNYSQNAVIASPVVTTCPLDALIPTLTSSSDVPGPIMVLQYDPSVPLYNYITNNRVYPDQNIVSSIVYNQFTTNFTSFLEKQLITLPADIMLNFPQIRSSSLGVIVFASNAVSISSYSKFTIVSPIALFTNFIYGLGTFDVGGNYIRQPGMLKDTDIVTMSVTNISLVVMYNGVILNLETAPTLSYSGLNSVSFSGKNVPIGQSYGIQYIGSLSIIDLQLPFAASTVYNIDVNISYSVYINGAYITSSNQFDFFQTGILTNVTKEDSNITTTDFSFTSSPPLYETGTFDNLSYSK